MSHNPVTGPLLGGANAAAIAQMLGLLADEDPSNPGFGALRVVLAGASGSADRELLVTTYRATAAGTGFSSGDTITATRVLDVSSSTATQIGATIWYNETTGAALGSAPSAASLQIAGTVGLTDAQLRASAVAVTAGGYTATPVASAFARPADTTAYAVGDLVSNSTTAASCTYIAIPAARVAAGSGLIRRVMIRSSSQTLTNASYRVHLYNAQPASVAAGDNAAINLFDASKYLGSVDVTLTQAFASGTTGSVGYGIPSQDIAFKLASGVNVYALLEARAARTPDVSEQFVIGLDVIQD